MFTASLRYTNKNFWSADWSLYQPQVSPGISHRYLQVSDRYLQVSHRYLQVSHRCYHWSYVSFQSLTKIKSQKIKPTQWRIQYFPGEGAAYFRGRFAYLLLCKKFAENYENEMKEFEPRGRRMGSWHPCPLGSATATIKNNKRPKFYRDFCCNY